MNNSFIYTSNEQQQAPQQAPEQQRRMDDYLQNQEMPALELSSLLKASEHFQEANMSQQIYNNMLKELYANKEAQNYEQIIEANIENETLRSKLIDVYAWKQEGEELSEDANSWAHRQRTSLERYLRLQNITINKIKGDFRALAQHKLASLANGQTTDPDNPVQDRYVRGHIRKEVWSFYADVVSVKQYNVINSFLYNLRDQLNNLKAQSGRELNWAQLTNSLQTGLTGNPRKRGVDIMFDNKVLPQARFWYGIVDQEYFPTDNEIKTSLCEQLNELIRDNTDEKIKKIAHYLTGNDLLAQEDKELCRWIAGFITWVGNVACLKRETKKEAEIARFYVAECAKTPLATCIDMYVRVSTGALNNVATSCDMMPANPAKPERGGHLDDNNMLHFFKQKMSNFGQAAQAASMAVNSLQSSNWRTKASLFYILLQYIGELQNDAITSAINEREQRYSQYGSQSMYSENRPLNLPPNTLQTMQIMYMLQTNAPGAIADLPLLRSESIDRTQPFQVDITNINEAFSYKQQLCLGPLGVGISFGTSKKHSYAKVNGLNEVIGQSDMWISPIDETISTTVEYNSLTYSRSRPPYIQRAFYISNKNNEAQAPVEVPWRYNIFNAQDLHKIWVDLYRHGCQTTTQIWLNAQGRDVLNQSVRPYNKVHAEVRAELITVFKHIEKLETPKPPNSDSGSNSSSSSSAYDDLLKKSHSSQQNSPNSPQQHSQNIEREIINTVEEKRTAHMPKEIIDTVAQKILGNLKQPTKPENKGYNKAIDACKLVAKELTEAADNNELTAWLQAHQRSSRIAMPYTDNAKKERIAPQPVEYNELDLFLQSGPRQRRGNAQPGENQAKSQQPGPNTNQDMLNESRTGKRASNQGGQQDNSDSELMEDQNPVRQNLGAPPRKKDAGEQEMSESSDESVENLREPAAAEPAAAARTSTSVAQPAARVQTDQTAIEESKDPAPKTKKQTGSRKKLDAAKALSPLSKNTSIEDGRAGKRQRKAQGSAKTAGKEQVKPPIKEPASGSGDQPPQQTTLIVTTGTTATAIQEQNERAGPTKPSIDDASQAEKQSRTMQLDASGRGEPANVHKTPQGGQPDRRQD